MGVAYQSRMLGQVQQNSIDLSSLFGSSLSINPTLLLMGGGLLLAAVFLFGSSPERVAKVQRKQKRKLRRASIGKQIEDLKKEQKELGGGWL